MKKRDGVAAIAAYSLRGPRWSYHCTKPIGSLNMSEENHVIALADSTKQCSVRRGGKSLHVDRAGNPGRAYLLEEEATALWRELIVKLQ